MSLRTRLKARLSGDRPERGTLVVSTRSLHGKLYNFWRDHSEFKNAQSGYRENLCHYVRVVLLWAPIALFLHAHPKRLPFLRPAVIVGMVAALTGITFAIILNPGGTLLTALLIVCSAAVAFGLFFLAYYIDDHKVAIRTWFRNDGQGTRPLKFVLRVLGAPFKGLAWLFEHAERIGGYQPVKRWDMPLGGYLFLAAVITGVTIGSFYNILVLVFAVGVIVLAALFVGLLIFADWLRDVWPTRPVGPPRQRDENIFKVGARFAVAKKGKICPFIEVQ